MSRATFTIAAGVVLCSVAFVVWKSNQPATVEVTKSVRQDITSTLAVSGVLEAVDRSTISSQIAGAKIAKVLVDIGDQVQKGQLLAEFDSSDAQAQVRAADALIAQAVAQSKVQDTNESSANSNLQLAEENMREVNDLRIAVKQAKTNQQTASQRVKQFESNLSRIRTGGREEQIRQSKSQLLKAETTRDLKKREFERAEMLWREGALSKANYDVAKAAFVSAQYDVDVANENVKIQSTPRPEDVRQAEAQLNEAKQVFDGATSVVILANKNLNLRIAARQQVVQATGQKNAAIATKQVTNAQVMAGKAQKQSAMAQLAKTQVRAQFSGRISQRLVEPGQTVNVGTPLFLLAGNGPLRIRLNVDEANISLIKKGDKATVSIDAFPDLQLPAVISDIGTAADFQKGTVEVRLQLLKSDPRLKPELTADVNLIIASYKNSVVVPRRAVMNPDDSPEVYVVKNGRVESHLVKWSRGNSENIVITEGLEEGEQVLLAPRFSRVGDRVNAVLPKISGAR
jgi:HlyD family secretion protein